MSREHDSDTSTPRVLSRRNFLIFGGGAAVALAAGGVMVATADGPPPRGKMPPAWFPRRTQIEQLALAVTDGWAGMPRGLPASTRTSPTRWREARSTPTSSGSATSPLDPPIVQAQAGKAQVSAPTVDATVGEEVWVTLSNLGLLTRPDLVDYDAV